MAITFSKVQGTSGDKGRVLLNGLWVRHILATLLEAVLQTLALVK